MSHERLIPDHGPTFVCHIGHKVLQLTYENSLVNLYSEKYQHMQHVQVEGHDLPYRGRLFYRSWLITELADLNFPSLLRVYPTEEAAEDFVAWHTDMIAKRYDR